MSKQRSLSVNDETFDRFNALKLRIAVANSNRIIPVNNIIRAMMVIGERHYDELLREILRPTPNRLEPLAEENETE